MCGLWIEESRVYPMTHLDFIAALSNHLHSILTKEKNIFLMKKCLASVNSIISISFYICYLQYHVCCMSPASCQVIEYTTGI